MCLETVIRLSLKSEAMKLNYDDAQSRLRKAWSMQGPDDINNEDNLIYFFIGHCRPPCTHHPPSAAHTSSLPLSHKYPGLIIIMVKWCTEKRRLPLTHLPKSRIRIVRQIHTRILTARNWLILYIVTDTVYRLSDRWAVYCDSSIFVVSDPYCRLHGSLEESLETVLCSWPAVFPVLLHPMLPDPDLMLTDQRLLLLVVGVVTN